MPPSHQNILPHKQIRPASSSLLGLLSVAGYLLRSPSISTEFLIIAFAFLLQLNTFTSISTSSLTYPKPNLVPPITTVKQCLEYRDRLRAIEPNVDYLMSLYLHESITPETIREAKEAGITGVKSYPAGVTTVSISPFIPQAYMLRTNLSLHHSH
jgi:hypothetical protein